MRLRERLGSRPRVPVRGKGTTGAKQLGCFAIHSKDGARSSTQESHAAKRRTGHTAVVRLTEGRRRPLGVDRGPHQQALRTSDRSSPSRSSRRRPSHVVPISPDRGRGRRCHWAVDLGHILAGRGSCTDPDEADHILGRPCWEEHRSQAMHEGQCTSSRQSTRTDLATQPNASCVQAYGQ